MGDIRIWAAVAGGCVILAVAYVLLRRRRGAEPQEPLISLVLLLRGPRALDRETLARAADRALGVSRVRPLANVPAHVPAAQAPLLVQAGGFLFGVLSVDHPYVDDVPAVAETIPDLRLRRAFSRHEAWLAVDLLQAPPHADGQVDLDEAYRYIGKLIAELAGDDCLVVFAPATNRMNVVDDELLEQLRGEDPLGAVAELAQPPVIEVADDDPRIREAVAEAKRRWPEFVAAFNRRRADQHFAVKAPFTDGENVEFIWVDVTAIEGETIRGELGNEPVDVTNLHLGDDVDVPLGDLNDWMYGDENEVHGGFTTKVLLEVQQKRR